MEKEKKGISDILVTMIVLLLTIGGIITVSIVVTNIVKGQTGNVELSTKCINVNVDVTKVICTDGTIDRLCTVTFSRTGSEDSPIGGVKVVFRNSASGKSSPALIDVPGNIEHLVGKIQADIDTGMAIADDANRIEVTAYFEDESGNEQLCSQTSSFPFVA